MLFSLAFIALLAFVFRYPWLLLNFVFVGVISVNAVASFKFFALPCFFLIWFFGNLGVLVFALTASVLHLSLYHSVGIAFCDTVALIIELFTLTKTDAHFYS